MITDNKYVFHASIMLYSFFQYFSRTAPEEFESKLKALEEEKARLKSFSSNEESSSKLNQSEEVDRNMNFQCKNERLVLSLLMHRIFTTFTV